MEKIKSFASLCIVSRCLKALGILSKILEEEELCIVRAIEAFLRRKMSLNEMKARISKIFQLSRKFQDKFNKRMFPVAAQL